jgi:uncharacterized membrane protein YdjX (TVP38/TMEM64 family)/phosphatidylserine/phosphatidylglycerophosphate/cardiolipin synthase-like enzyme
MFDRTEPERPARRSSRPSWNRTPTLFEIGRNAWRIERASRAAVIADAGPYFHALARAIERAERQVVIVGWDIHSRTPFAPRADGSLEELGPFLHRVTRDKPELEIWIVAWESSPIYFFERELLPGIRLEAPRVHFCYATDHATGASHHQKIAVVDDRVAFAGGIDLTIARWDVPEHRKDEEHRKRPNGEPYAPVHDVQMAVEGDAARAIGELARERFKSACGERIAPPDVRSDPWPEVLEPDFRDVEIAISRTHAAYRKRGEVREAEAMYLDMIAAAEHTIYVENQYFTSRAIGEAVARRLADDHPPEILLVTPKEQCGVLEERTLGVLRAKLVEEVGAADAHGRFRVLCPVVDGVAVNVHSKVLIADDRLLKVGSANMSNRSMALDTECDLSIEARTPSEAAAIRRVRDRLLAEHLGRSADEVARAIDELGSVSAAIEVLQGGGRRFEPVAVPEAASDRNALEHAMVADPEGPLEHALVAGTFSEEAAQRAHRRFPRVAAAVAVALAVAGIGAIVAHTPNPETIAEWFAPLREHPLGPLAGFAAFVAAALAFVPVTILIVAAVLVFGPWWGTAVAISGTLVSATFGWLIGRTRLRRAILRFASPRLERLQRRLADRGLLAALVVRIVPVAPFAVVNILAGSAHLRFRHFLLATAITIVPGVIAVAFASDRVVQAVLDPSFSTIAVAVVVVGSLAAALRWLGRFIDRSRGPRTPGR